MALIERHETAEIHIESHHIYSHMDDMSNLTPKKQGKIKQWI